MTSLFEQISEQDSTISKDTNHNISSHGCRNGLRLKEKKVRPKCNKVLKRKLKKYKLRQDGQEDRDILDVSRILEYSLAINSPGEEKTTAELELEQLRPTNYLFKMGRKKQANSVNVKSKVGVEMVNGNGVVQLSPTTEEKKQTNAFKLLMDSRNKSLGCNSPGKEKPIDETEMQELLEKKSNKAKRNLILQKMAESKGSLMKREIEENQEKYINKKMEKRAERLKSMISNIEPKAAKVADVKSVSKLLNGRKPLNSLKTDRNEKHSERPVKTLELVNMFTEVEQKICLENKVISKEDEEFLNKLSPSLKKKQSMLSYFKKVEKDCTITDNENNVIKVKLGSKAKKKIKKKKLSLNKGSSSIVIPTEIEAKDTNHEQVNNTEDFLKPNETENTSKTEEIISKERRKRKACDDGAVSSSNILDSKDDIRSKRSAKRPVKYNEDAGLHSSDDELHIFTPKKKKHSDSKSNPEKIITVDVSSENEEINEPKKSKKPEKKEKNKLKEIDRKMPVKLAPIVDISSENEEINEPKKSKKQEKKEKNKLKEVDRKMPVKLAPIFSSKTQLDPAAIEAKQKFLQSGVPEKLKKNMLKQVDKNIVSNCFLKVVHIQQLDEIDQSLSFQLSLKDHNVSVDDQKDSQNCDRSFQTLLNMATSQDNFTISSKHISSQVVLQNLKEKYPRYPVYRTYRLLRGKKRGDYKVGTNYLDLDNSMEILNASIDTQNDNPEQLSWSDKYKPLAASQIIGNFESIKELRKWLVTWTENDIKSKVTNEDGSDSSDYYQSDGDSKDSVKSSNNLLVLSGPVGSGKTSSVYAIAAELSIKVIEVNASSKRTGKIMLQDLQEATQSHKVNRKTSSNENSQNSQKTEVIEVPIPVVTNLVRKRGRPKKVLETATPIKTVMKKSISKEKSDNMNSLSASQDVTRTCMSLILIDDADIVFDQDDGFCSAIVQLVQSSKRPVILITSSLSCLHLQRFIQSSKLLKMNPLLPNILGTWLDIMCLADSGICWPGVGSKVLNLFNGDVRKTINCLQFYVCSQEQALNVDETCSQNTDSRINVDDENSNMSWIDRFGEDKNLRDEPNEINDPFKSFMLKQVHSIQYNLSTHLFNVWWSMPKLLGISNQIEKHDSIEDKSSKSLESISQVLDSISLSDFYSPDSFKKGNIASDPWFSQECHSVSELENFDKYDRHYVTREEIAYELASSSISIAQVAFGCEGNIDLDFPGMTQQRLRDRIISRHNNLTSYLSPQAVLDRKALALDYWSSSRTICRIEKSKTDTNSKRNNRFCHYLKSLSVLCKNDSFDKLANSLLPSELNTAT